MSNLLGLIAIIILMFLLTMVLIIWGWSLFMVPVFGMQGLTLGQAFGFTLLASAFKPTSINKK